MILLASHDIDWPYVHFAKDEVRCKGVECDCGGLGIPLHTLMEKLELIRELMKMPLKISSGYRCPSWNDKVSKTGLDGPHVRGLAADVVIHGADAFKLVKTALMLGFTGIGIGKTFTHIDCVAEGDSDIPRPRIWSY